MSNSIDKEESRLQVALKNAVKKWGGQTELAKHLEISQPYVSDLISGKKKLEKWERVVAFAKKLGIDPLELMDVDLVHKEELQRDEHIPVYVVSEFKSRYAKPGTTIETLGPGTATVPKGSEMTIPGDVGERRVGIRLETNIYEPTFKAGDILITDPSILPSIGNICLVLLGEEMIFRRLEYLSDSETRFSWPNAEGRLEVFKLSIPMQPVIWGTVTELRRGFLLDKKKG
jgi:predicted XRE-type DNA-binding protein